MPVDRKRKTKTPKEVPEPGDPDRKRVLNVLAQRRYREKRKAKIEALEAQAQTQGVITPKTTPDLASGNQDAYVQPQLGNATSLPQSISDPPLLDFEIIEEIIREEIPQEESGFPAMDFDQEIFDMQLLEDISFGNLPTRIPSPGLGSRRSSPDMSPSWSSPSSVYTLSVDGGHLQVPMLSTIRAFTTIANMLDIINKVWDPLYLHTLPPGAPPSLPPNLHPTTAQMTIPHHPFLDALPWPSVREKLICMFSLPSSCRPRIAQDDDVEGAGKAIMRLVLDIDDPQDGMRVHGNLVDWGAGSELVEEAWEIGEVFYKNWWWCLDGKVIRNANRRRRERGLEPLTKMYEL